MAGSYGEYLENLRKNNSRLAAPFLVSLFLDCGKCYGMNFAVPLFWNRRFYGAFLPHVQTAEQRSEGILKV